MHPLLRRLKPLVLGLRRDHATGQLYYPVDGVRHFVRNGGDIIRAKYRRQRFEHIFFRDYRPRGRDCVVDIGAGLGTEIIPLARMAPDLHYVAVEIQPHMFECLCLTLAQLPSGFVPFGLAIGAGDEVRIQPTRDGDSATVTDGMGAVPISVISWDAFVRRHGIGRIDLLKMNIEGAEADLLEHADLTRVARVIVGTHDFRADRGDGEQFRTRARVERRLAAAGFKLTPVGPDWIYADREEETASSG
jgi:FkbM family methyltransferase